MQHRDGDVALKEAISVRPTFKDVGAADGMEVLRAGLEEPVADDKAAVVRPLPRSF